MRKISYVAICAASIIFLSANFSYCKAPDKGVYTAGYEKEVTMYLKNKDYAGAKNYLEKIVQVYPKFIEGYVGLAIINWYSANYQEAASLLNRAMDLYNFPDAEKGEDLDIGTIHLCLGIVYRDMGNEKKAKEELLKATGYYENDDALRAIFFTEAVLKGIK